MFLVVRRAEHKVLTLLVRKYVPRLLTVHYGQYGRYSKYCYSPSTCPLTEVHMSNRTSDLFCVDAEGWRYPWLGSSYKHTLRFSFLDYVPW